MAKKRKTKKETKNDPFWTSYYYFASAISVILVLWAMNIYRKTFIEPILLILVIISVSLITLLFSFKCFKVYFNEVAFFSLFIRNMLTWGFFSCFLFLSINYYFSHKDIFEYKTLIKQRGSLSGPKSDRSDRTPYVIIDYHNFEKKLTFRHDDMLKVNSADSVLVYIKKGKLGFEIIYQYKLF